MAMWPIGWRTPSWYDRSHKRWRCGVTRKAIPLRSGATCPNLSQESTSEYGVAGVVGVVHGRRYTYAMADDSVLDEIQDNTKEAGLRLRASLSLLHSQGMIDEADYRELALRLRSSLAMVEAAYMEARRRG
jgi:hypothetical protein